MFHHLSTSVPMCLLLIEKTTVIPADLILITSSYISHLGFGINTERLDLVDLKIYTSKQDFDRERAR